MFQVGEYGLTDYLRQLLPFILTYAQESVRDLSFEACGYHDARGLSHSHLGCNFFPERVSI